MAVSKEVADEMFASLKLDVSKWFDGRCKYGVSMLKLLYSDLVKNNYALHECSKTMEILELLIGAGHLTQTNLTLLYETIKVTQQFSLEQLIKDRHPSFLIAKDIKNIEITEFTLHRQRLVNLGMALIPDEIQQISGLYNIAEKHENSWSFIMDLEQKLIICEGKMEEFIERLKNHGYLKPLATLTEDMDNERTWKATTLDSPKMATSNKMKCFCGNERQVKYYCQECTLYLCSSCSDYHKTLPMSANHKIHSIISLQKTASLHHSDIGIQVKRIADCLKLKGGESVTQGQPIIVKVIKTDECDIQMNANQLKATWTHPTGEANITQVEKDDNGDYFVTGKCTSPGICVLDVSVDGESIKQSPLIIKVEKEGLVNTIHISTTNIRDVVQFEDDCLLVSLSTNEIHKYNLQSEYIDKVTLPEDVKVTRMYKMKSGNIAFCDLGRCKCIKVCNMNGEVIKTLGGGILKCPCAILVNETSNVVYVADSIPCWLSTSGCVLLFDFDSGNMIRKFDEGGKMCRVTDIALTHEGHILVAETNNLKLFDNEGTFLNIIDLYEKTIHGVVVDQGGNIIVSRTFVPFRSNATSYDIQVITGSNEVNKYFEIKYNPGTLSIISYHPRRIAVISRDKTTCIQVLNY